MTADQIVRVIYSGAIGFLAGLNYGLWAFLIVVPLILIANLIGETFGSDR